MRDERSRCYELLGVAPGASAGELKAAHRDLVKVWHPDRFSHDPRLREKAQEKLKEINEAYEFLTSDRPPRRARADAEAASQAASASAVARRAPRRPWWPLAFAASGVFGLVFFVASRTLVPRAAGEGPAAKQTQPAGERRASAAEPPARERKPAERRAPEPAPPPAEPAPEKVAVRPLPSVTVLIDPTTGLLATRDCPVRSRTNYVAGSEPRRHCDAHRK